MLSEERRTWSIAGSLSLAITIPWIFYRVVRAIYLKKSYSMLQGKVVVITGASSGLGEALAHEFYKQGCQVVLCARRRNELERVRNELLQTHPISFTYQPIIMPLDLSEINDLPEKVKKIVDITGRIDLLVNNGGISHRGSVLNTNADVDIKIMLVNYFGSVVMTKAVLPYMVKQKNGHVICVSSIQGLVALPERSAYSASKHALQAFADSLRAEVAKHSINVTLVSPGYIKTQLSVNALTGSGVAHGKMDSTTEGGYSPEYVAQTIVDAAVQKKKEVVVSTFLPRIAVFLRKYFPALYFYVMACRAKRMST